MTFGETMALLTSERLGPLEHSAEMTLGIGGSESNVAIGLARLGRPVTWYGRVGNDPFGELVARQIRAEGVTASPITDRERPTGLMVKERRTPSVQRVHYYRTGSAGSGLQPSDIPAAVIHSASVLHATGITAALSESCRETVLESIREASRAHVPVSFDLNFRSRLWEPADAARFYALVLPQVDLAFASAGDAALVFGHRHSPVDYARTLVELGARAAVVTLGHDGALAFDGEAEISQEAVRVPVIDTVGAGDGFVAGYLAELVAGGSTVDCLRLAAATAAFACMSLGDWEGLPRADELDLLRSKEPVSR